MNAFTEVDHALASANEWQGWTCWLYTTVGRRFVLSGEHGPEGMGRDDQAYLIFRCPRQLRLPWYLYGEAVRFEREAHPTDQRNPCPHLGEVIRVGMKSGGQSYSVDCAGVELHTGPLMLPSARHPAVDYCYRSDLIVRLYDEDAGETLHQFLGEPFRTLEWSGLHVSHGQLRLLASGGPRGGAVELRCFGTSYLDLADTMTRPRLRLATRDECEALRAVLPANLISDTYPPRALPFPLAEGEVPRPGDQVMKGGWVMRPATYAGYLIIECEEGRFHLLTANVALRRLRRRTYSFSYHVSQAFRCGDLPARLLEGGPE